MINTLRDIVPTQQPGKIYYPHEEVPNDKPLIAMALDQRRDEQNNWVTYTLMNNVEKYFNFFTQFGANILLLNFGDDVQSFANRIDGFVVPGGTDMDPAFYNEQKHEKAVVKSSSMERCNFDAQVLKTIPKQCPYLGICYGCQFLNVFQGGNLNQHINEHESHHKGIWNTVKIDPNSELNKIIGKESMKINCFHHQLPEKIGENLKINSYSEDGLIHGLELVNDEEWKFSIQWHPERNEGDEDNLKIGEYFVQKCRNYKEQKMK